MKQLKINLLLILCLFYGAILEAKAAKTDKNRPNIICIMVDDAGYGDFGCYGQKLFATPNIDRMAKEGSYFPNAVVTSSLCSPSRATILTGPWVGSPGSHLQ